MKTGDPLWPESSVHHALPNSNVATFTILEGGMYALKLATLQQICLAGLHEIVIKICTNAGLFQCIYKMHWLMEIMINMLC